MVLLQIREIIFQDNRPPFHPGNFFIWHKTPEKLWSLFFLKGEKKISQTHFASFIYKFISSNSLVIRRLKFFYSSTVPSVLLHKGMYSRVTKESKHSVIFSVPWSPLWGKQHAMFQQRCFLHCQIQFFQSWKIIKNYLLPGISNPSEHLKDYEILIHPLNNFQEISLWNPRKERNCQLSKFDLTTLSNNTKINSYQTQTYLSKSIREVVLVIP